MATTFASFAKYPPILYGSIVVGGKEKSGSFVPLWNKYSNSMTYHYHTLKGHKGTGGFTLMKAFRLFSAGALTTNPTAVSD